MRRYTKKFFLSKKQLCTPYFLAVSVYPTVPPKNQKYGNNSVTVTAAGDGKIVNGIVPETFRKHVAQIFEKAYVELPRYLQNISGYKNL